jgi:hypothetical protein
MGTLQPEVDLENLPAPAERMLVTRFIIVWVVPYEASNKASSVLNLRVADIHACYRDWKAKRTTFMTEPLDRAAEVRCYMQDADGYLIEVGQATGMLKGVFAKERTEDQPG